MAKDSIGSLALLLSADSSGLAKDLAKAEAHVKGFAAKSSRSLDSLASAASGKMAAIGASLAVAAGSFVSVSAFEKSIKDMVEMDKAATKLGMSIRDMSLLMTMEGPDFSTEAMLTGIRKLQEHLQDAIEKPAGEVSEKLKAVKLDAEQMISAGTLESLKMFADAIKRLAPAERLSLAELMGKGGHELIPILQQGRDAFNAMNEAAAKGQAVTEEMAASARKAASAWDDIGDAATAARNKIASSVAPFITREMQKAAQNIEDARGWFERMIKQDPRLIGPTILTTTPPEPPKEDPLAVARAKADAAKLDTFRKSMKEWTREIESKKLNFLEDIENKLEEIGLTESEITIRRARNLGIMGEELSILQDQVAATERKNKLVDIRNRVAGDLAARIGEKPLASDALVKGSQEDITFGANLNQPRFTLEDAVKAIPDAIKEAIDDLNFRSALEAAVKEAAKEFAENIQVGVFN